MDSFDPRLLDYARTLRKNMTPHERKLWHLFLKSYPVKFYRQRVIGSYIVDFYCASAKLILELDGSQHFEPDGIASDRQRSDYFEAQGLRILRIANNDIDRSFPAVCAAIHNAVHSA